MDTLCMVLTDEFPIAVRLAKPVSPIISVKKTTIKNDNNNRVLIRNFLSINFLYLRRASGDAYQTAPQRGDETSIYAAQAAMSTERHRNAVTKPPVTGSISYRWNILRLLSE